MRYVINLFRENLNSSLMYTIATHYSDVKERERKRDGDTSIGTNRRQIDEETVETESKRECRARVSIVD